MAKLVKKPKETKEKRPLFSPDVKGFFLVAFGVLGFFSIWSFHFQHPDTNWLGSMLTERAPRWTMSPPI